MERLLEEDYEDLQDYDLHNLLRAAEVMISQKAKCEGMYKMKEVADCVHDDDLVKARNESFEAGKQSSIAVLKAAQMDLDSTIETKLDAKRTSNRLWPLVLSPKPRLLKLPRSRSLQKKISRSSKICSMSWRKML